jgi:hypothetical protein
MIFLLYHGVVEYEWNAKNKCTQQHDRGAFLNNRIWDFVCELVLHMYGISK